MKFIFLLMALFLLKCNVDKTVNEDKKKYNIYEDLCHSKIQLIFPSGEIDKIRPDGVIKSILFDSDKNLKYYVISDSISINIDYSSNGRFFYILAYNTLHNQNVFLAYLKDKYGLWLGIKDSVNNLQKYNEAISGFNIELKNDSQAIEYATFYIRISNNGGADRLPINNIREIWLLSQFWEGKIRHLKAINSLSGDFFHLTPSFESKKWVTKPEIFPNYSEIYNKYENTINEPVAFYNDNLYTVIFFIWNQYSGNLERWEMKFSEIGKIISVHKKLLAKRVGHFRGSKLGILTVPD